ncbi:60 kDa SS-A/Ro ribonucleoprotein, partial [Dinochytrium kinnereticum]
MSYLARHIAPKSTVVTPQTEPIPGREADMAVNNAGGYSFTIDPITRLNRFLILGCEKGSYYASERELTIENATVISKLIEEYRGIEVVQTVLAINEGNRAAKQDPSILALAMCIRLGDDRTKKLAHEAVLKVCRIPTTFFQLLEFIVKMTPAGAVVKQYPVKEEEGNNKKVKRVSAVGKGRGFGRAMRRTIATWYNDRQAKDLAYTITKYKNRNGWTHADV